MLENQPAPTAQNVPPFHAPDTAKEQADALVARAQNAPLGDGGLAASKLLSEALEIDPHHHEAQLLREQLHQMFVPRWHFPMMADKTRNAAYAEAIAAKVKPGDIVLDIGSGAGLTAMLAARAGAEHVYACEQQPMIAEAAKRVIAANGLSHKITVISKWSHNIVIGEDMPERADVVLSEIVDSNLLGEGALATLAHAMATLAKPGARAIPESGTVRAQLVESEKLVNLWRPQEAEGFDLSAFHHFASVAQVTPNDFTACGLRPLGPTTDLFHFDFANPSIDPDCVTTELTSTDTGTIHAVCLSFEMVLAPGISVSNGLGTDDDTDGHWGRTAFLLDRAVPAHKGARLTITAQHDATKLSISVHEQPHVIVNNSDKPIIQTAWQPQLEMRAVTAH
ncbi:50S ribosomal protein L11 methyltransferase [Shimia sp. R9_1]|nr:50S ribosomal protein L11 methyltransferase [Shimia sp. R9_1]MBO9408070.1 50S ribosomal protein L11 methyltransferase [Shimia sp. R9_1]